MRILVLAILTIATVWTAVPAQAQTYDPAYPVCMHVFRRGGDYYECSFTSLEQCKMSASGRSAMCDINPYFAGARRPPDRQQRRVY
jgi:hypothetical protein